MKNIFNKYKELIMYVFFGGCTTLINIISYYFFSRVFNFNTILSTIFSWCIANVFAYVTNKIWVFNSKSISLKEILIEITTFISGRVISGIIDIIIMFLFVDVLCINDLYIKVISNVVVIIINYLFSKFFVFKK